MTKTRHDGIVVVGAGYAGMHAARAASRRGVEVVVVDPEGVHGLTTRLAAVAGGTAPLGDAWVPLHTLGLEWIPGRAMAIGDGQVSLDDGTTMTAGAVVVTAGAEPVLPDIPGLERALPLRTPRQALTLRHAIEETGRLVVAGGGATGVQLAGAVASSRPDVAITLVERGPDLLAGMSPALGAHAAAMLRDRGVDVRCDREVVEVTAHGVELDDGSSVRGVVAWVTGFESSVDSFQGDLPRDGNGLAVDDRLRVVGMGRTFAAGDLVAHRTPSGEVHPMAAQIAVQAGARAGSNAAASVLGRRLRPADLHHRGWVLDFGGYQGVAELGPVPLAAPLVDRLAPLLHLGIDLRHLFMIGGPGLVAAHAPGAHRPSDLEIRRVTGTVARAA